MPNDFSYFACSNPGLGLGEVELTEVHSCHGQHYWKAVIEIKNVFGSEVDGQIQAIGPTKEKTLERLKEEIKKTYETLWI